MRGATPFLVAAKAADVRIMRALVAAGANPALTANDNTTPLMAAAGLGDNVGESRVTPDAALEAVKLAVTPGNDVRAANDAGETALHAAAYFGANDVVKFLVEQGADVNATNRLGSRPLTIAIGYGQGIAHPSTAAVLRTLGGVDEVEIEGTIAGLEAPCPAAVFTINRSTPARATGSGVTRSRVLTIKAVGNTQYVNGGCASLRVGSAVRVTGKRLVANVGPVDASGIEIR
jgi:hypothetical protein